MEAGGDDMQKEGINIEDLEFPPDPEFDSCLEDFEKGIEAAADRATSCKRPITRELVEASSGIIVWYETPDAAEVVSKAIIKVTTGEDPEAVFHDGTKRRLADYGRSWRCWDGIRPTDKARAMAKWSPDS